MTPERKQLERDAIAAAVAAFKKKGGTIDRLGASGYGGAAGSPYSTHERKTLKEMVASGYSPAEIANTIGRSEKSVRYVMDKIGLKQAGH